MKFGNFFAPMLLEEMTSVFDSPSYLYELKFDGIRASLHVGKNMFHLYNRRGKEITYTFPELKNVQQDIKDDYIFDGEIVLFENGKPNFSKLQERSPLKDPKRIIYFSENSPVCFIAFDCVYKNKDISKLPLLERKKVLEKVPDSDYFVKSLYIIKEGKKLFEKVRKAKLEGIVAKKIDSVYEIDCRSKSWIKIKNWQEETFFIGAYYIEPLTSMIKLFVGEFKENKLYFVGKVMMNKKNNLYQKLVKEKSKKKSPFCNFEEEDINYISPKLTCVVSYIERTEQNHLRQAVFKK